MADNHLFDGLFAAVSESDAPLLTIPDGLSWSYQDVLDASAKVANCLQANGVKPGDRIAVQVQKSPEALVLYIAAVRSGAVFLPLNTAYTRAELAYFIEDAEPTALVCDSSREKELSDLAEGVSAALLTLDGNGEGSLMNAALNQSSHFNNCHREANDLAAILYTSGTTGLSKGAMLSHDNLLSNSQTLADYWKFSSSDILLHALPIFHTHGLFVATNVILLSRASMIFMPRFDVDIMLEQLPNATSLMGVPTFYTRLLTNERFNQSLVGHIRLFVSGSAPLLAETHIDFEKRTGHRILERYGMTETNMNTSNPYDGERRAGTVGFPLPGVEVQILNEDSGEPAADGNIGMIEVRGPNVFMGYWRKPEKTAAELKADGFFITGDLGRRDEDGYIHILGREKDLIISGGFNIYPKQIEVEIDGLGGVIESAVFGVPDPDFGESVAVAIVVDGTRNWDQTSMVDALKENLAKFKLPRKVFILDELPRNTMGKVQKNILRQNYGA
jgi:malonyl-CoA/methylmalonyl-CoA synthetase